ncbi:MAG: exodeoxyribonuclease VII large subunit [Proteobacteria bacterium]|nr:exodeoxyribonuclease VII large subunit [Pseudomonadota bacterium]
MATESLAPPAALPNLPEYSVGELSAALRRTLEETYGLVRVRGEVSGFKRAASGHLYFSLKDAEAVLDAVCWRFQAQRLALAPEDGLEVICTGRITTYPGRSKYQIVVEGIELAGVGALLKMLEERKRRLAAEGLFAAERKRRLPYLPEVIGVVTSPTGAVIRDILHRLADRFPRRVVLWPVPVQGEGAAEQVAAAIAGFNRLAPGGPVPRPDLLIVARGGGSLEDLMAFNEEIVVRAAAASEIPLISAVGHDNDTTLIDFAADVRAPTPTAAAEMAVPVRAELLAQVLEAGRRLFGAASRLLEDRRLRLAGFARGLPDLRAIVEERARRLDDWAERLLNALPVLIRERAHRLSGAFARLRHPRESLIAKGHVLASEARALASAGRGSVVARERRLDAVAGRLSAYDIRGRIGRAGEALAALAKLLDSVSYRRVLERGFVLVRDAGGEPVTAVAGARPAAHLTLTFHDGEAGVTVDRPGARGPRAARPDEPGQGRLL